MKKMMVMATVIAVLFAISAGASWFIRQGQATLAEHGDAADAVPEKAGKGPRIKLPWLRRQRKCARRSAPP